MISIHKALASLDYRLSPWVTSRSYFNPQGSREPRRWRSGNSLSWAGYFNPQGSREPRRNVQTATQVISEFQSTRLSRASTWSGSAFIDAEHFNPQGSREPRPIRCWTMRSCTNFNPQGSREPRHLVVDTCVEHLSISIHKALASLDPVLYTPGQTGYRFQSTRLSRASTFA